VQQLADPAELARGVILRGRFVRRAAELAAATEDGRAELARAELTRARAFDRVLLDSLSVGVVACDATGQPGVVNKVMRTWLDEQHAGEQGRDLACNVPDPDQLVLNLFEVDGITPVPYGRTPLSRALRGELVRDAEPVHDDRGALLGAVVTLTDVTRQRELEAQLREAALHDPLTGLPNRSLLLDRIGQVLTVQRRSEGPGRARLLRPRRLQAHQRHRGARRRRRRPAARRHGPAQRDPRRRHRRPPRR
jgi:hypothetical protein